MTKQYLGQNGIWPSPNLPCDALKDACAVGLCNCK